MNLKRLKKIIVVQGQGSSGKTAILNKVCAQLIQTYGKRAIRHQKTFATGTV